MPVADRRAVKPALPRILRGTALFLAVAVIGWIDYASGPHIGVSLFYLIPVIAAAWYDGLGLTAAVAAAAGIAWFAADVLVDNYAFSISVWNGFTRLAIFLTVGFLLGRLRAERERLARTNQELEAFTYSVSHDLRSPLIHIGTFAGMLDQRIAGKIGSVERGHLDAVKESAQVALNLIDGLLEFSHLGRTPLHTRPVDLAPLLDSVRRELENDDGRAIEWRIGPLPVVQADPALLRVVLYNLLANAMKYTRPRSPAIIEVGARPLGGNEAMVWIRDNGVGFDPRYRDKLFRVFERLHGAHEFEGTGIGLALAQRVISRHNGRIWAEGDVGSGATFFFTLPGILQAAGETKP